MSSQKLNEALSTLVEREEDDAAAGIHGNASSTCVSSRASVASPRPRMCTADDLLFSSFFYLYWIGSSMGFRGAVHCVLVIEG